MSLINIPSDIQLLIAGFTTAKPHKIKLLMTVCKTFARNFKKYLKTSRKKLVTENMKDTIDHSLYDDIGVQRTLYLDYLEHFGVNVTILFSWMKLSNSWISDECKLIGEEEEEKKQEPLEYVHDGPLYNPRANNDIANVLTGYNINFSNRYDDIEDEFKDNEIPETFGEFQTFVMQGTVKSNGISDNGFTCCVRWYYNTRKIIFYQNEKRLLYDDMLKGSFSKDWIKKNIFLNTPDEYIFGVVKEYPLTLDMNSYNRCQTFVDLSYPLENKKVTHRCHFGKYTNSLSFNAVYQINKHPFISNIMTIDLTIQNSNDFGISSTICIDWEVDQNMYMIRHHDAKKYRKNIPSVDSIVKLIFLVPPVKIEEIKK